MTRHPPARRAVTPVALALATITGSGCARLLESGGTVLGGHLLAQGAASLSARQ